MGAQDRQGARERRDAVTEGGREDPGCGGGAGTEAGRSGQREGRRDGWGRPGVQERSRGGWRDMPGWRGEHGKRGQAAAEEGAQHRRWKRRSQVRGRHRGGPVGARRSRAGGGPVADGRVSRYGWMRPRGKRGPLLMGPEGPGPGAHPEYRARPPSSRQMRKSAWNMPRYRTSRNRASVLCPCTCSRVLVRSTGNVPAGTAASAPAATRTGPARPGPARPLRLTELGHDGGEPAIHEGFPVERGHRMAGGHRRARRRHRAGTGTGTGLRSAAPRVPPAGTAPGEAAGAAPPQPRRTPGSLWERSRGSGAEIPPCA